MAEIICQMNLKRLGQTQYEAVAMQYRTALPVFGEIIDVTVNNFPVRGCVTRVSSPPPGSGTYYVHMDEVERSRG